MDVRGRSVYVGLSGGVDSAVSAVLLQQAGARVTGVFMKGWYPPGMPCTWALDRRDAMRVAARLHIPFLTLDASLEYKRGVIDYLLAEYRAGRTPNPDVMCNREVKFGAFYRYAKEKGVDLIATGHYVQGGASSGGSLFRGADVGKDQSYFLWAVPTEALSRSIFPVGNLHKSAVRSLARRFHLPVATKKDSQGVCFLGSVSVEEFLRHEFGEEPGQALDEKGNDVGRHHGVLLSTLGERISLEGALPGPWYIIAKNIEKKQLIVSHRAQASIKKDRSRISFTNAVWHRDTTRVNSAQSRYHGQVVPGSIEQNSFLSSEPLSESVAPGQSIVFYDNDEVIGGGIISA